METLGALAYLRNKLSSPLGMEKGKLGVADKLTTSLPMKLSHLVKHSGSQQSDQKKKSQQQKVWKGYLSGGRRR